MMSSDAIFSQAQDDVVPFVSSGFCLDWLETLVMEGVCLMRHK